MKQVVYICDGCKQPIEGAIYQRGDGEGDFCNSCLHPEASCSHENNISDATAGRDTARLICKDCGYDRVEAVEEILTI